VVEEVISEQSVGVPVQPDELQVQPTASEQADELAAESHGSGVPSQRSVLVS
jgi:hypothetical protein